MIKHPDCHFLTVSPLRYRPRSLPHAALIRDWLTPRRNAAIPSSQDDDCSHISFSDSDYYPDALPCSSARWNHESPHLFLIHVFSMPRSYLRIFFIRSSMLLSCRVCSQTRLSYSLKDPRKRPNLRYNDEWQRIGPIILNVSKHSLQCQVLVLSLGF